MTHRLNLGLGPEHAHSIPCSGITVAGWTREARGTPQTCFAAPNPVSRIDIAAALLICPDRDKAEGVIRCATFRRVASRGHGMDRSWIMTTDDETTDFNAPQKFLYSRSHQFDVGVCACGAARACATTAILWCHRSYVVASAMWLGATIRPNSARYGCGSEAKIKGAA